MHAWMMRLSASLSSSARHRRQHCLPSGQTVLSLTTAYHHCCMAVCRCPHRLNIFLLRGQLRQVLHAQQACQPGQHSGVQHSAHQLPGPGWRPGDVRFAVGAGERQKTRQGTCVVLPSYSMQHYMHWLYAKRPWQPTTPLRRVQGVAFKGLQHAACAAAAQLMSWCPTYAPFNHNLACQQGRLGDPEQLHDRVPGLCARTVCQDSVPGLCARTVCHDLCQDCMPGLKGSSSDLL
jgi:hypothetical protein